MTESASHWRYYAARLLPIVAAATIAAGCSTTNIEDVAPVGAVQATALPEEMQPPPANQPVLAEQQAMVAPPAASPPVSAPVLARGAIDTETFPNLNIPPEVAAEQITPEERAAKLALLKAKQTAVQGGRSAGGANRLRLKRLAETHADDTLQEIENE